LTRPIRHAGFLLIACFLCILAPAAALGRGFSLPEYLAQLDRLSTLANRAVDDKSAANTALEELRPDWTVTSEGQSFKINTGWLTDQFEKLKDKSTVPVRDEIRQRLGVMRANAAAFQNPPADAAAARQKLTEILSRNEFHQVHGASWLDRLKFRVAMWIYRTLSKMFGASSAPTVGKVFVWALVGIAVLALAYFIFRTIRQNARLETIMPEVLPVSSKQWRIWMKEAREAAARGEWRDAVHLGYWAGISFLEASGMWRPDQARTPREYMRLLPSGSQHRNPLQSLTRRLEVTWYGNQAAGAETFSETMANLEELGCRD